MLSWLDRLPMGFVVVACLTLGLAPFAPPHVWEKLLMLIRLELSRPIDWLDLLLHGAPWVVLLLSLVRRWTRGEDAAA